MPDISTLRPVRKVYLGLTAGPYDPVSGIAWTPVPNVVVSTTLDWGAQHELGQVEPTHATFVFDNADGAFEPLNPASTFYPNLRPLNRIRVVDTWAGVDYVRCTLFVASWPRSWDGFSRAKVTVEAYDALGTVLAMAMIPQSPWEMAVRSLIEQVPSTGKAVWLRVGESSGAGVAADSSGYGIDGAYQGSPTLGVDGLIPNDPDKAFQPVVATGGDRILISRKDLLSGYPCFFHAVFILAPDRTRQKVFVFAADGPAGTPNHDVEIFVDSNFGLPQPGKVVVNVYEAGTYRRVYSSVVVDDSTIHRVGVRFRSATDITVFIDGVDRTVVDHAGSPFWPTDLNTGWAIGNTPAVSYGDFAFCSTIPTDKLDEPLFLDGYAPTDAEIAALTFASFAVPFQSGDQLRQVLGVLGWPTSDIAIDQGASTVQGPYVAGSAAAYGQKLALTEGGRLFVDANGAVTMLDRHRIFQPPYTISQATFGEGAGEIGYIAPLNFGEDDQDIYNDIPVSNAGGKVEVARDKTSRDAYGQRTLPGLTGLLGTSDAESIGRAQHDLALFKDPKTRFREITIEPQNEDVTVAWPALLGLAQSSRVTLKVTPPGASLITQPSLVEHFSETVTAKDWQIVLRLSAAETLLFGIWGTSNWDGAAWAY